MKWEGEREGLGEWESASNSRERQSGGNLPAHDTENAIVAPNPPFYTLLVVGNPKNFGSTSLLLVLGMETA